MILPDLKMGFKSVLSVKENNPGLIGVVANCVPKVGFEPT
jgi:hypothetical protein